MQCDMCGKNTSLFRAVIEDTEMRVCKECGGFGKVFGELKTEAEIKIENKKMHSPANKVASGILQQKVIIEELVENYPEIIRKKREKLGMTQKEFAVFITERESILHKIETGHFEPNIKTARKLEKLLKVKLIETHEEESKKAVSGTSSDHFTIGDMITIKKRQ